MIARMNFLAPLLNIHELLQLQQNFASHTVSLDILKSLPGFIMAFMQIAAFYQWAMNPLRPFIQRVQVSVLQRCKLSLTAWIYWA
jgi:hypothetical protein